jgi:hypothetical protein
MMRRFVLAVTLAVLCASCAVEREGSTQGEGTARSSDAGGDADQDGGWPPPDATCGTDDAGGPQPDAGSDTYPDAGGYPDAAGGYPDAGDPYPDAGGHPYPDAGAW